MKLHTVHRKIPRSSSSKRLPVASSLLFSEFASPTEGPSDVLDSKGIVPGSLANLKQTRDLERANTG